MESNLQMLSLQINVLVTWPDITGSPGLDNGRVFFNIALSSKKYSFFLMLIMPYHGLPCISLGSA